LKIQQLLYTSCKKGLSSGAGFQTYSMSKGINEEERKEIETYCVYIPPDNLPTQPTKEEIELLFPIVFSYFILKNGKYCICQGKYIGKDYSGRYGNYICHVLVFDTDYDFYPIELYKSMSFREALTLEEENASTINYLPELDGVHLGNVIHFESISKYLKETVAGKKNKNFRELMQCIIDFNNSGKKIVFSDHKESIPYLIGALEMALPKKLSKQFAFTTYAYNPEDVNYILCAVDSKGSKFNFKTLQNSYKYSAFDFSDNENRNVKLNSSFTKLAEIGFTVSKEVFLPFIDFITQFEYNKLDQDIDNCLCLYNMVKKGIAKSDTDSVKRAVNFAINYKSIEAYKQLFYELQPNLEKISTEVDIELTEIITKFLFKMGRETGCNEHIEIAYDFFFNSIHYLVMDAEEVDIDKVMNLYKNIKNLNTKEFVEKSLEKTRVKELITYMEGAKVRHAKFYFQIILCDIRTFNENCKENDYFKLFTTQQEDNKIVTIFLYKCLGILIKSSECIKDILHFFKTDYEYCTKIILTIYCKCIDKGNILKEILIEFIVNEGKEKKAWRDKMYFSIGEESGGNDLLLSIYQFQLSKNFSGEEFFIDYCNEVFSVFKNYRKEKFKEALNLYLNYCKNEDIYSDDISLKEYEDILNYIIDNSLGKHMDKLTLKKLLTMFENKIQREDAKIEDYIVEKVFNMKKEYKIKTSCSIIELLYAGKKLEQYGFKAAHKVLQNLKCNFKEMDGYQYEKYLEWFLPNICVYLKEDADYGKVKKTLYCDEYGHIYFKQYIKVLKEIVLGKKYKALLKECNVEADEVLLDFIIFTLKNICSIEETKEDVFIEGIVDILREASEKKIKIYSNYVNEKTKNCRNKEEVRIQWRHIIKRASGMEKGTFLKIKNFFD
jgi:hypothetical protein